MANVPTFLFSVKRMETGDPNPSPGKQRKGGSKNLLVREWLIHSQISTGSRVRLQVKYWVEIIKKAIRKPIFRLLPFKESSNIATEVEPRDAM